MNNIENRYRTDSAFRTTVDQMRVLLSQYHLTPNELREAAVLASTLHEAENIRPLLIQEDGKGCIVPLPEEYYAPYKYEYFYTPPAMFGGAQPVETATGANLNSHAHVFENTPYGFKRCACGISDVYYEWSTTPAKYYIEYKYKNSKYTRSHNAAITMSKGTSLNIIMFKNRVSAEKEATAQQKRMSCPDYTYRVAMEKK
jgi:hypothetical protein